MHLWSWGSYTFSIAVHDLQDKHTSTLVMANLQTTGDMCLGAFMAGVVVTIAHLPGRAYTEFLCIFTAIGLIPLATTRARYMSKPQQVSIRAIGPTTVSHKRRLPFSVGIKVANLHQRCLQAENS